MPVLADLQHFARLPLINKIKSRHYNHTYIAGVDQHMPWVAPTPNISDHNYSYEEILCGNERKTPSQLTLLLWQGRHVEVKQKACWIIKWIFNVVATLFVLSCPGPVLCQWSLKYLVMSCKNKADDVRHVHKDWFAWRETWMMVCAVVSLSLQPIITTDIRDIRDIGQSGNITTIFGWWNKRKGVDRHKYTKYQCIKDSVLTTYMIYETVSIFLLLIKKRCRDHSLSADSTLFLLQSPVYLYYFSFNLPVFAGEMIKHWKNTFIKMVLTPLNF